MARFEPFASRLIWTIGTVPGGCARSCADGRERLDGGGW